MCMEGQRRQTLLCCVLCTEELILNLSFCVLSGPGYLLQSTTAPDCTTLSKCSCFITTPATLKRPSFVLTRKPRSPFPYRETASAANTRYLATYVRPRPCPGFCVGMT